jgi:hypothetical protein
MDLAPPLPSPPAAGGGTTRTHDLPPALLGHEPDGAWRCVFNRAAFHRLNLGPGDRLLQLDEHHEGRPVGSLSGVLATRDGVAVLTSGHSAPFGGLDLVRTRETPERIDALVAGALSQARDAGAAVVRVRCRPEAHGRNDGAAVHALLRHGLRIEASDLTFVIGLDDRGAEGYRDDLRRPARRALRHLEEDGAWSAEWLAPDDDAGWRAAHALLAANRAAKGRRLALDAPYVLAARDALGPAVVRMLVLRHAGAPVAAALAYAATAGGWYVVAWGDHGHELSRSPMNLLALRVVEAAAAAGGRFVDLGVSSVPGSGRSREDPSMPTATRTVPAGDADSPMVDPGLAQFKTSIGARPWLRLTLAGTTER